MICKKCGNQCPDDAKFCTVCGEEITNPEVQNAEASANEHITTENPIQTEGEQLNTSEQGTELKLGDAPMFTQPKKKKKAGLIIGIIAAFLALIVALCGLAYAFIPQVRNFVRKTFSSGEDYLEYVVDQNTEGGVSDLADAIGTVKDIYVNGNKPSKVSGCMTVEFDYDAVNGVVEKLGGEALPDYFKQVNQIKFEFDGESEGMKSNITLKALLKDNSIVSINMFLDEQNIVFQIPEFSEEYLYIPLSAAGQSAEVQDTIIKVFESFPDDEKLEKLINRYIKLAVSEIDGVEKTTDTLEIGDVSQKCTKLTVKIDENDILVIIKSILNEAKDDSELKDLIKTIASNAGEDFEISDFEESIDDALSSLEEAETGDTHVDLSLYVDGKADIIGCSVEVPDGDVEFTLAAPQKGKDIACLFEVKADGQTFDMRFIGTEEKDIINGTAEFRYNDTSYVKLDVENLNTDEEKDQNAKLTISLDKGLKDLLASTGMPSEYGEIINGAAIVIDVKTEDKGNKLEAALSLAIDGTSLVKVSYAEEIKDDSNVKIEMPDISNAYNIMNDDEIEEYFSKVDMNTIATNIMSALPPELVEAIMDSMNKTEPGEFGSDTDIHSAFDADYGVSY